MQGFHRRCRSPTELTDRGFCGGVLPQTERLWPAGLEFDVGAAEHIPLSISIK